MTGAHGGLALVAGVPIDRIDPAAVQAAVADLLSALGQDLADPQLRDTPRRVAAALVEMLSPIPFHLTTFPNDDGYDELVLVRDIPVRSLCAHHMLPFVGVAHVAYLPGDRILGLSKLARVVELFARGLQVQERLTTPAPAPSSSPWPDRRAELLVCKPARSGRFFLELLAAIERVFYNERASHGTG